MCDCFDSSVKGVLVRCFFCLLLFVVVFPNGVLVNVGNFHVAFAHIIIDLGL